MFNADNEFEKLNQQVKMEEEKYLNAEVTIDNYKFPHIYLTEEEIEQFNKECDHYGIDIKVVPLSTYMNLNSPDKISNPNEDDEIDIEQKEKNIDKFMNHLGKNYQKKENQKDDKFIGKKRNKILEDDSEQEESNISSYKSKSHVRKGNKKNKNIVDDEYSEKSNLSQNYKGKKDDFDIDVEEEKSSGKKDSEEKGNKKKKKLLKKKKNLKKTNEISEKFENYFRKIKETRKKQIDDVKRKNPLIQEILEKSQFLTKEDLKEVAKGNRIGLIDDSTLSQNDLNKKDANQLDRILVDININSNVLKLNSGGKENIKKIKERMERVKKSEEDREKNKRLKEQRKSKLLNENKQKNKSDDKKESDISDNDSLSDDDLI